MKLLLHGVGSYGPGMLVGPARWPHYDLIIVEEGSLLLSVEAKSIECEAGDAFLIPPNHSFRGVAGERGASIWVQHFSFARHDMKTPPRSFTRWKGVGKWEWSRTLMRRLSWIQIGEGVARSDRTGGLLLLLLLEEFKAAKMVARPDESGARQTIQLAIDKLENHLLPLPTLKEIAHTAGWSVNYFRDQFRAISGRTLGDFLKQRRLAEAARLLVETRRPIKEIAMLADYSEPASFHRAFFQRYHLTPGKFRSRRVLIV